MEDSNFIDGLKTEFQKLNEPELTALRTDVDALKNKPVAPSPKRYINETGSSGTTRWEKYNDGFKKLWMTVSGTVQTNFPFPFSSIPNVTCARYGSPDHVHDVFTVSTTGVRFYGAAVGTGVKYDICVSGFSASLER